MIFYDELFNCPKSPSMKIIDFNKNNNRENIKNTIFTYLAFNSVVRLNYKGLKNNNTTHLLLFKGNVRKYYK